MSVAFGSEMGQMIGEKSADAIVVSIENEEQKALPKRITGKKHSWIDEDEGQNQW